jgi:hypothetical protein
MTHDPLCVKTADPYSMKMCECELIAKARKDEADRVMRLRYQQVWREQAIKDCIAVVEGLDLNSHYRMSCEPPSPVDWSIHNRCDAEMDILTALRDLQEKP